jgi:uncharacterized metal-binding protein YceD (DUF177 family)
VKKKLTECIIPISSLKNGDYNFRFNLTGELFTDNQFIDIHSADFITDINFTKNSSITMLHFKVEGNINITCDRCGDDFNMLLALERQLILKTNSREHQEEDDMVSLSGDEHSFDAAPYIYQYVVLSLPMQRIHPDIEKGESGCNSEAMEKLKHIHVEKSNDEKYVLNSNMHYSREEKPLKTKLKNNK